MTNSAFAGGTGLAPFSFVCHNKDSSLKPIFQRRHECWKVFPSCKQLQSQYGRRSRAKHPQCDPVLTSRFHAHARHTKDPIYVQTSPCSSRLAPATKTDGCAFPPSETLHRRMQSDSRSVSASSSPPGRLYLHENSSVNSCQYWCTQKIRYKRKRP